MVDMIQKANRFLSHYWDSANPIWKIGLTEAYEDTPGAAHVIELTQKKINKIGGEDKWIRVVPEGPRTIAREFFTKLDVEHCGKSLPSEIEEILEFLKNADAIMQIGGGHGRATLINGSVSFHKRKLNEVTPLTVHKHDVGGLADAMISAIARQQDDLIILRKENEEYQNEISKLQAEVSQLRSEVAIYSSATWA